MRNGRCRGGMFAELIRTQLAFNHKNLPTASPSMHACLRAWYNYIECTCTAQVHWMMSIEHLCMGISLSQSSLGNVLNGMDVRPVLWHRKMNHHTIRLDLFFLAYMRNIHKDIHSWHIFCAIWHAIFDMPFLCKTKLKWTSLKLKLKLNKTELFISSIWTICSNTIWSHWSAKHSYRAPK